MVPRAKRGRLIVGVGWEVEADAVALEEDMVGGAERNGCNWLALGEIGFSEKMFCLRVLRRFSQEVDYVLDDGLPSHGLSYTYRHITSWFSDLSGGDPPKIQ